MTLYALHSNPYIINKSNALIIEIKLSVNI